MSPERSLASFAAACFKLHLSLPDGVALRDVEASLCEDGETVMLYAPDGRGHYITASFSLPYKADPESFDPKSYVEVFELD